MRSRIVVALGYFWPGLFVHTIPADWSYNMKQESCQFTTIFTTFSNMCARVSFRKHGSASGQVNGSDQIAERNWNNFFFGLFRFRSAIWSDPYTWPLADPRFLKLTRAHALSEVVKIVNWRDPCFIHLRSPEQYEKCRAFRRHWQKCKKTNGSGFRRCTQTEYRFDIGVKGSMSQGLQLKN